VLLVRLLRDSIIRSVLAVIKEATVLRQVCNLLLAIDVLQVTIA